MKRASTILESARLDRELNFEEISKKTKIPVRYLIAFENENTADFPAEPYCSLMLKDYAEFLGLHGEELLSLFRRDHDRRTPSKNLSHPFFSLTPQFSFSLFIGLLIFIFLGYLALEYYQFNQPPKLSVDWPSGLTPEMEISGQTSAESTVRINDSLVIVDAEGNFKKTLQISTSEADIVVEARSPAGKITRDEKKFK